MGTRADFYVKRDECLLWLGSIAWDGYPEGIAKPVIRAETEDAFCQALAEFLAGRDDVTLPERGWPWPWDDSNTSDYGYVFVPGVGVVHAYFGGGWIKSADEIDWGDDETGPPALPLVMAYPDMSARKNVRFDGGSGMIFVTGRTQ